MCSIHNCFNGSEICCAQNQLTIHYRSGNGPNHVTGAESDGTNIASKIRSLEHFDAQILLDSAHNLHSIVEVEMCVLITNPLSAALALSVRILFSSFPNIPLLSICTSPVCPASIALPFPPQSDRAGMGQLYPV